MTRIEKIAKLASSNGGAIDRVATSRGTTREELARKWLAISHGKMVRTHQS